VASLNKTRVLFVCLGNSCRSPMAEAIAIHIASDILEVSSAGLSPLGRVQTLTKITLERNGYPVDGLESKPIAVGDLAAADIIVNMTGRPGFAIFPDASKVEDWIVDDPYGASAEAYQRTFEDVEARVVQLVARVRKAGTGQFAPGKFEEGETNQW
jgi:arsenate reductase (thioredoxin)